MKKIRYNIAALFLGLFPLLASAKTPKLDNPIASNNITTFLGEVLKVITTLSIPVIVAFIIYAGFLFVTAGGNEGKVETAQKTIQYTLIGAAIILGARFLAEILINTAESLGVDNLS